MLDDPVAFELRAGAWLEADIARNVLATTLAGVRTGRWPSAHFAVISDASGAIVGAALRTPPRAMVCTRLSEGDADELMARWLTRDPELPGINADAATARALVAAHGRHRGATDHSRPARSMALHALDPAGLTPPPRPGPGRLRAVGEDERSLVAWWGAGFMRETGFDDAEDEGAALALRLIDEGRGLVWDDGGAPVSLVGHTVMVAGVPRVGPVYTPPEHRGRGYAGSAVHALSARLFGAGARQVVLFTDLANPTSNKIYAELGYRRVLDWEEYVVEPAGP